MKFSYLAFAGILCILGYGHGSRFLLGPCENSRGYVYILSENLPAENAPDYVQSTYQIIGASLYTFSKKIGLAIPPYTNYESVRYPVVDCKSAQMEATIAAFIHGYHHGLEIFNQPSL